MCLFVGLTALSVVGAVLTLTPPQPFNVAMVTRYKPVYKVHPHLIWLETRPPPLYSPLPQIQKHSSISILSSFVFTFYISCLTATPLLPHPSRRGRRPHPSNRSLNIIPTSSSLFKFPPIKGYRPAARSFQMRNIKSDLVIFICLELFYFSVRVYLFNRRAPCSPVLLD